MASRTHWQLASNVNVIAAGRGSISLHAAPNTGLRKSRTQTEHEESYPDGPGSLCRTLPAAGDGPSPAPCRLGVLKTLAAGSEGGRVMSASLNPDADEMNKAAPRLGRPSRRPTKLARL